jgi:hypothetical protein
VIVTLFVLHVLGIREKDCGRPTFEVGFDERNFFSSGLEHAVRESAFFPLQEGLADRVLYDVLFDPVIFFQLDLVLSILPLETLQAGFVQLGVIRGILFFFALLFLLVF